jgi:tRNA (mo5U34)-methyltransferase
VNAGAWFADRLRAEGLSKWADVAPLQWQQAVELAPHGDWPRWRQALDSLPALGPGRVALDDGALWLRPAEALTDAATAHLRSALMELHPWRKGPYRIDSLRVDTEWRSDWKWGRLAPHIDDLAGRLVLDVGCGNGYHAWRAALGGARFVVGIDPTAVFLAQFLAIRELLGQLDQSLARRVHLQPIGIEALPGGLRRFDTVFSMGVLYHRRAMLEHLVELREALRPGGQLVLETLVIQREGQAVLVPEGRYAKMRNVWFIPSPGLLETCLRRAGFTNVTTVDITITGCEEQRSTAWMTFESLADFLDPADSGLTIEGHPAPRRAIAVASAR